MYDKRQNTAIYSRLLIVVLFITLTTSCSLNKGSATNTSKITESSKPMALTKSSVAPSETVSSSSLPLTTTNKVQQNTSDYEMNQNISKKNISTNEKSEYSQAHNITDDNKIAQKTKDYILNGQGNISGADTLNWSESFLDLVDFISLYKEYISGGGKENDIKSFALYITENAPVPSNWEELFIRDILKSDNIKITKLVLIDGVLYQAYAEIDGAEIPYVSVSARTGFYHG